MHRKEIRASRMWNETYGFTGELRLFRKIEISMLDTRDVNRLFSENKPMKAFTLRSSSLPTTSVYHPIVHVSDFILSICTMLR